ncbi:hypothetical protein HGRIS_003052 [Hohenbuehelia grisea]|uniref:Origin recognition complex subunit 5 C-terminal domain-containing protein n=1 Tax=Hohenbuehelia grisea TaxID=104357 RepID=A0ABR3JPF0_9AGAR
MLPEAKTLSTQFQPAFLSYPPPFIHVNSPTNPRRTAAALTDALRKPATDEQDVALETHVALVDGIAAFTSRIFYDTVINSLAGHHARWETGCSNWSRSAVGAGEDDGERYNESFASFVRGLQAVKATHDKRKVGEGRGNVVSRYFIVVTFPERMRDNLAENFVPITRLAELSQLDTSLSVIFVSAVRWEDIRPPVGASPDPYFIDIGPLSKQDAIRTLVATFLEEGSSQHASSQHVASETYHPTLQPLYAHFITTLVSVCYPFTQDPDELMNIAAAQWPAFAHAALQSSTRSSETRDSDDEGMEGEDDESITADGPSLPNEQARMRLLRQFTPSMTAALEALYPRLTNATDWAANAALHGPMTEPFTSQSRPTSPTKSHSRSPSKPGPSSVRRSARHIIDPTRETDTLPGSTSSARAHDLEALPRMHKFILLAAFIASNNPAKSDLRMFGRGVDERTRGKRRRRGGGAGRKGGRGASKATKIPQRLVGPSPFPLDRLLALLGALLEEHDVDDNDIHEEGHTDIEVGRAGVLGAISALASTKLLHRTSVPDKLDGPPTFKCGIAYEAALELARDLDVQLGDLLWEVVV